MVGGQDTAAEGKTAESTRTVLAQKGSVAKVRGLFMKLVKESPNSVRALKSIRITWMKSATKKKKKKSIRMYSLSTQVAKTVLPHENGHELITPSKPSTMDSFSNFWEGHRSGGQSRESGTLRRFEKSRGSHTKKKEPLKKKVLGGGKT